MEAVIATGGKQYCVTTGQVISVEKLPGDKGAAVEFKSVLLVNRDYRLGTTARIDLRAGASMPVVLDPESGVWLRPPALSFVLPPIRRSNLDRSVAERHSARSHTKIYIIDKPLQISSLQ